jgi:hypothetical protein
VCALGLVACSKKDDKKKADDKPAAAMGAKQGDAMQGDAMKSDAMKAAPKGKADAKLLAEKLLKLQAALTDVMVKALPDCDKAAKVAMELLDKPENKNLAAAVKRNAAAVKTAQSALLKADKSKGAFVRGRLQVMIKCKGNAKHKPITERLKAMWK